MFSGSFMVIAVLVVFASQVVSSSLTTVTVTPAPSSTTESTFSAAITTATPVPTATNGGLLTASITTVTPAPSATIGVLPSAAITTGATAAILPTGTLTLPLPLPPLPSPSPSPSPSTATPSPSPSPSPSTATTGTTPTPEQMTCGHLSLVITKKWDESYLDNSSSKFNNITSSITADIPNLFKDTNKYGNVKQDQLDLTKKDGYIGMAVKLCIEVKTDDADSSVIDVLNKLNKNGKLGNMEVKEDSVTFKEIGVDLKDWEVQDDDECNKCSEGGGGPIVIKRDCTSKTQSCKGLKTKKSDKCVKYCGACAAVAISSFTLIMGIILSFSFNIWK